MASALLERRRVRVASGLFLLAVGLAPAARAEEAWGKDKAAHLAVSFGLGSGAYAGLRLLGDDGPGVRITLSLGLALAPGLLKEIYDSGQPRNHFSGVDLAWDVVGAVSGALVAFGIDWLVGRWRRGARGPTVAPTKPRPDPRPAPTSARVRRSCLIRAAR